MTPHAAQDHRSLRRRVAEALDPDLHHTSGLSLVNALIGLLVVISTLVVVMETEPAMLARYRDAFLTAERAFVAAFTVEYLLRAWTARENPKFGPGLRGLTRFVFSAGSLIDLAAIIPTLIMLGGHHALSLRLLRILRVIRVVRLGRLSNAWAHMLRAIGARREELFLAFTAGVILLLVSSTLLYLAEGDRQPEAFGSIPRAMWWSVTTLATIGYGDAVPVTFLGKLLAGLTALCGIGVVAMPTGIIAAALSDSVQLRRLADELALEREQRELEAAARGPEGPVGADPDLLLTDLVPPAP